MEENSKKKENELKLNKKVVAKLLDVQLSMIRGGAENTQGAYGFDENTHPVRCAGNEETFNGCGNDTQVACIPLTDVNCEFMTSPFDCQQYTWNGWSCDT